MKIPSWNGLTDNILSFQFYRFADASRKAYGAVVYLKIVNQHKLVKTSLLVARSKTIPILTTSVPRLELCAAFLLSKLLQVKQEIDLSAVPMYCWSDSTTVLSWLGKTPSTWPTFVANRVALIQTNISEAKWNHVFTTLNPADCISRGRTLDELPSHPLWWHGPPFLSQSPENWPCISEEDLEREREKCLSIYAKKNKGIKKATEVCLNSTQTKNSSLAKHSDKTSCWPKLIKITALCYRFIDLVISRLRMPKEKFLTTEELNKAKIFKFRYLQTNKFSSDIKSIQSNNSCLGSSSLKGPFLI